MKSTIARLLAATPLANIPVRVRGGAAKGARWTLWPFSSYWRGQIEQDVDQAIQTYVKQGATCWDLGTHFGIYTIGMARRAAPTGRVFGFEPNPIAFAKCSRHVRMNRLERSVTLFKTAVSDCTGTSSLLRPDGRDSSACHLSLEDQTMRDTTLREASSERVAVDQVRIDDLVAAGKVALPQFVKIDVEGYGAKAIRGAFQSIRQARPIIVISFHSQWELDETRDQLAPLGYRANWSELIYKTEVLVPD